MKSLILLESRVSYKYTDFHVAAWNYNLVTFTTKRTNG